ncbi:uncharacterized protein LOC136083716 [Hydra vulgaris]|uniref:Uncharacterized protein LOC136083716 n=1 Tax=Hydra vulgaris TaxID=6087 RepID=A0ABM4CCM1_HYDVU
MMKRIFKILSIFLLCSSVVLPLLCPNAFLDPSFVEKVYPDNTCTRKNTVEDFASALSLKTQLEKNPLVCSATSHIVFSDPLDVELPTLSPTKLSTQLPNKLPTLSRKKREVKSWKNPQNLPAGSQIAYCSNFQKCCNPKKSLNDAGTHYNLCRECVHLVILPASYSPRQHYHVTCQDVDYYEACFTGEGGCATNMVSRTVMFNSTREVIISLGHSCSCEILRNSVFSDFI